MASGGDSFAYMVPILVSNLNLVRDAFACVGIFFCMKHFCSFSWSLCNGFVNFVWARIVPQENLSEKYGKWALVTGSTDGIGMSYARELARRGLNIILVSRCMEKLKRTAAAIEADFEVETFVVQADFASGPDVYDHIKKELDGKEIGILVNNVGVMPEYPKYFTELTTEMLWKHVFVNVGAATMMSHLVLPQMMLRGKGVIVNLSSASAVGPLPLMSVYSASKVYIDYLSKALHEEYSRHGVFVQSLMPFYVNTNMTKFSDTLASTGSMFPDAPTFARSAVYTLPYASWTTGYWSHGVQYWLVTWVNTWWWMKIGNRIQLALRRDGLKNKQQ